MRVETAQPNKIGDDGKIDVAAYAHLCPYMVSEMIWPGEDFDSLVSDAQIALLKAADKYDSARGTAFSTFACALIKNAVRDHRRGCRRNQLRTVRMPEHADRTEPGVCGLPDAERREDIEEAAVFARRCRAALGEHRYELLLRRSQQEGLREIAADIGVSLATVLKKERDAVDQILKINGLSPHGKGVAKSPKRKEHVRAEFRKIHTRHAAIPADW